MQETRTFTNILKTVTASLQTDPGCVREQNEDTGRYINPIDPDIQLSKGVLTIVADGMGGHASGEVASRMAVEIIANAYYADPGLSPSEALGNAIQKANYEVYKASVSNEAYFGMGTTLVAMVLMIDQAIVAHVGDSRLYRLRGDELALLTIDHSEVMQMVMKGIITLEEAHSHEDKNVILRAVGTQAEVQVEISKPFSFKTTDKFMLCSDGLSDMLTDEEIRRVWLGAHNPFEAAERLINEAKLKGGHDNVTVGVIHLKQDTVGTPAAAEKRVRITREVEVLAQ